MCLPLDLCWSWVNLGAVTELITSGSRDWAQHYSDQGAIFVRMGNLSKDSYALRLNSIQRVQAPESGEGRRTRLEAGDLLVSITGDVGMLGLIPEGFGEAYINQHTCLVRFLPELRGRYFPEVLRSSLARVQFNAPQRGIKNSFRLGDVGEMFVPLPPIEEQHRIVAKLDELMALCDRLEAARAEREAARDRLVAASLARLNVPDPETFADDARFALDALPALTTRYDHIKQLRQTILNLAVGGWLSSLDARCQEPVVLGTVAKLQNGYAFKSEWFAKSGVRLLRNTNVAHGVLDWHDTVHLPEGRIAEFERFRLREGDVVLSLDRPFIATGTKVATISKGDLPALLLQRVGRFVIDGDLDPNYLLIWINSPHFSEQIDPGRSNGVPHVSSKQVESAKIILPRLDEQRRFVAKVRELMALCDQLESCLKANAEHSSRLLEVLVQRVLEPSVGVDEPASFDEALAA